MWFIVLLFHEPYWNIELGCRKGDLAMSGAHSQRDPFKD